MDSLQKTLERMREMNSKLKQINSVMQQADEKLQKVDQNCDNIIRIQDEGIKSKEAQKQIKKINNNSHVKKLKANLEENDVDYQDIMVKIQDQELSDNDKMAAISQLMLKIEENILKPKMQKYKDEFIKDPSNLPFEFDLKNKKIGFLQEEMEQLEEETITSGQMRQLRGDIGEEAIYGGLDTQKQVQRFGKQDLIDIIDDAKQVENKDQAIEKIEKNFFNLKDDQKNDKILLLTMDIVKEIKHHSRKLKTHKKKILKNQKKQFQNQMNALNNSSSNNIKKQQEKTVAQESSNPKQQKLSSANNIHSDTYLQIKNSSRNEKETNMLSNGKNNQIKCKTNSQNFNQNIPITFIKENKMENSKEVIHTLHYDTNESQSQIMDKKQNNNNISINKPDECQSCSSIGEEHNEDSDIELTNEDEMEIKKVLRMAQVLVKEKLSTRRIDLQIEQFKKLGKTHKEATLMVERTNSQKDITNEANKVKSELIHTVFEYGRKEQKKINEDLSKDKQFQQKVKRIQIIQILTFIIPTILVWFNTFYELYFGRRYLNQVRLYQDNVGNNRDIQQLEHDLITNKEYNIFFIITLTVFSMCTYAFGCFRGVQSNKKRLNLYLEEQQKQQEKNMMRRTIKSNEELDQIRNIAIQEENKHNKQQQQKNQQQKQPIDKTKENPKIQVNDETVKEENNKEITKPGFQRSMTKHEIIKINKEIEYDNANIIPKKNNKKIYCIFTVSLVLVITGFIGQWISSIILITRDYNLVQDGEYEYLENYNNNEIYEDMYDICKLTVWAPVYIIPVQSAIVLLLGRYIYYQYKSKSGMGSEQVAYQMVKN